MRKFELRKNEFRIDALELLTGKAFLTGGDEKIYYCEPQDAGGKIREAKLMDTNPMNTQFGDWICILNLIFENKEEVEWYIKQRCNERKGTS